MQNRVKETNRYVASGSDGKSYSVIEYTEFLNTSTLLDSSSWTPGMKSLKLANGDHVNKVSDGKYQIVRTGVTLSFSGP